MRNSNSVSGASGDGVGGINRAVACFADCSSPDSVVYVPQVAEVDAIVVHANRLGVGLARDLAASISLSKLEQLIVGVLAIRSEAFGPNVRVVLLLEDGVVSGVARSSTCVSVSPLADNIVHEGIDS